MLVDIIRSFRIVCSSSLWCRSNWSGNSSMGQKLERLTRAFFLANQWTQDSAEMEFIHTQRNPSRRNSSYYIPTEIFEILCCPKRISFTFLRKTNTKECLRFSQGMHLKYNIFVILDNKFTILRVPPAWICRVVTNNHSKPKFQCSNLPEKMLHLAAVSNEFPDQLLTTGSNRL